MNLLKLQLHWQILIALALAVIAGLLTSDTGALTQSFGGGFHEGAVAVYSFFGTIFINALKMLIVPLIFTSIASGIANTGGKNFGRLGGKTLVYYLCTTAIAAAIGLLMINLINPGLVDGQPATQIFADLPQEDVATLESRIEGKTYNDIVEVFVRMVPPNVVMAAAEGQMLGLIFFALLFGFFITRISASGSKTLSDFMNAFFEVMMQITHWVMRFAPLGVFALVSKVIATTGFESFVPIAKFLLAVFAGLFLHMFVVMPLILLFVARVNPLRMYKAMAPAMLTAFSTSSSAATLPVTMDCVENRAGVSNRVSSFVLPMGATVNMDGTALFEVVAALFIAQAFGLHLPLEVQIMVVVLALVTSIGVAAVPSASMVAIALILSTLGAPVEAIGLILAVDRLPDMVRTVNNIFGDSCGTVVIAKWEGEDVLRDEPMPAAGSS